jgi:tetratricopeptide (TPR) repeat protein/4-amino-4-deoxy-L-arabinose transferase-like glycosyltransferase
MKSDSLKTFLACHGCWLIPLFALTFRFAYLAYYAQLPDWELLTVDNYYHHHWAESIASGNIVGDTTYFRAPLYVWCLGLLYSLFDSSWWVGRIFGIVVGAVSVGMTWMLAYRLFSPRVATIAALIHTIYPIVLYHDAELLTDSFFMLTLQIALYYAVRWIEDHNPRSAIWTGITLGIAALARPTALVLAPLILIFIFRQFRNNKDRFRQLSLFVVGLALLVSITFVRNLIVADDPVLVASQGGVNFFIGNNPESDGVSAVMPSPLGATWQMAEVTHIAEVNTGHSLKPGEVSSYWFSQGMNWIRENPMQFLTSFGIKLYRQLANTEIPNQRDLNHFLRKLPFPFHLPIGFGLLFPFAVWGIVVCWKQNQRVQFLVLAILLYMAATALFFVNSRFRLPLLPLFFLFASFGLIVFFQQIRAKSVAAKYGAGCIVLCGLISFLPLFPLSVKEQNQEALAKASYLIAERQYAQAVISAREAVLHHDSTMNAHLILGIAHLRNNAIDSALLHLQRETELFPRNEKGYINLASALSVAGEYHAALTQLPKVFALAPYDLTANQLLVRLTLTDTTRTIAEISAIADTAMKYTHDNPTIAAEIAAAFTQRKENQIAELFLRRALRVTPPAIETDDAAFERYYVNSPDNWKRQTANIHFQLGYLAGLDGRYTESIEQSKAAIINDPLLRDAYINLISGYISINQTNQADSVLNYARSLFPNDIQLQRLQL